MTTHADALRVKAEQATSAREAAEAELRACMLVIEPSFKGTVEAMQDRRWESRLEGVRPLWELAQAYSAFRKAQRAEAKANSAAYAARWAPVPAPTPMKHARKSRVVFTNYMRQRLAEERTVA
jgi:hypothetical protein